jgi:hypothetical protein
MKVIWSDFAALALKDIFDSIRQLQKYPDLGEFNTKSLVRCAHRISVFQGLTKANFWHSTIRKRGLTALIPLGSGSK